MPLPQPTDFQQNKMAINYIYFTDIDLKFGVRVAGMITNTYSETYQIRQDLGLNFRSFFWVSSVGWQHDA